MGGGSGLGDWLSETLGRFTDPDGYSIKQEFGFLTRLGFSQQVLEQPDDSSCFAYTNTANSTGVVVNVRPLDAPTIHLVRLRDGGIPEYPKQVSRDVPLEWLDLVWVVDVHSPEAGQQLRTALGENRSPKELLRVAAEFLKSYASAELGGDLSVEPKVRELALAVAGS
jgi:hypothetical protein